MRELEVRARDPEALRQVVDAEVRRHRLSKVPTEDLQDWLTDLAGTWSYHAGEGARVFPTASFLVRDQKVAVTLFDKDRSGSMKERINLTPHQSN